SGEGAMQRGAVRLASMLVFLAALVVGSRGSAVVIGDCDNNGQVTIDEVMLMVDIALGSGLVSACPAADTNSDGVIAIDEIIAAVGVALSGLPPTVTAMPTPSDSSTPTATA